MEGQELLEEWQKRNKIWHFESNTRNLTKLIAVLGYRDQGFGSAVEEFLNDNSGAQVAIVEWIAEWLGRNKDWEESMQADICDYCMTTVPPGRTCPECGMEGESVE